MAAPTSRGRSVAASVAAAEQVDTSLFRALGVLRLVVLGYALALNLPRLDEFERPALGAGALVVMAGWTAFVSWAYDAPHRRRLPLYLADLAVAVALMLSTTLVESPEMLDRGASTVPTYWVIPAVLAWAAGRHWMEAIAAAAVMGVADLSVRADPLERGMGNVFLLLLAAGMVGHTAAILRRAAEIRAAADREAAAREERTRLARAVHDGVLQVLALVQRRGAEPGAEHRLAELGRLAGEQESALRALIQYDARLADGSAQEVDLMAALETGHRTGVSLAGPGGPVPLPAGQAEELVRAVSACLDNVRRHVGESAPAWVLVEELPGAVVVTVRDEGPGIPDGRLEQASREGRLGVHESIRGRMSALGGSATLTTGPGQGVEWELVLPR